MSTYTYQKIDSSHESKVREFLQIHWGSPKMVISSGIYNCDQLPGFVCFDIDTIVGLVTYSMDGGECEVISLDSIVEGQGIGTKLMSLVEEEATESNCNRVYLVTTNDNLHALKFYQKRGYELVKIHRNAVEKARKIKPQIPLIGNDGIPIRDEIELEKKIMPDS